MREHWAIKDTDHWCRRQESERFAVYVSKTFFLTVVVIDHDLSACFPPFAYFHLNQCMLIHSLISAFFITILIMYADAHSKFHWWRRKALCVGYFDISVVLLCYFRLSNSGRKPIRRVSLVVPELCDCFHHFQPTIRDIKMNGFLYHKSDGNGAECIHYNS